MDRRTVAILVLLALALWLWATRKGRSVVINQTKGDTIQIPGATVDQYIVPGITVPDLGPYRDQLDGLVFQPLTFDPINISFDALKMAGPGDRYLSIFDPFAQVINNFSFKEREPASIAPFVPKVRKLPFQWTTDLMCECEYGTPLSPVIIRSDVTYQQMPVFAMVGGARDITTSAPSILTSPAQGRI